MLIPFEEPNNRVFYACQGVFVEERNTEAGNGGDPTGATFLAGVQAVGVSSDNPATSLPDVGRHQRKITQYGQQTIEITIDRVLDRDEDTFYKVTEAQYTDYQQSHVLHANNFGSKGAKDNNNKVLRNYDITIVYGTDKAARLGGGVGGPNPDANTLMSVSYLNCLITNISYTLGVDGVNESITLTTKNLKYNDDATNLSSYTFPEPFPASGNVLRKHHFDLTKSGYGNSKLPTEVKQLFNFDTPVIEGKDMEGTLYRFWVFSLSI